MHENENRTAQDIRAVCDSLRDLLLSKNARYGDSALTPVRIFSRADPVEALLVRIDDKLSRLARGAMASGVDDEDVVTDLAGYLVLLKVARMRQAEPAVPAVAPKRSVPVPPKTAKKAKPAVGKAPAEASAAKSDPAPAPAAEAHVCECPGCMKPTRPGKRFCSAGCGGRARAKNAKPGTVGFVPVSAAPIVVSAPFKTPEPTPVQAPAAPPTAAPAPAVDLPDGPSMTVEQIVALGFSAAFVTRMVRGGQLVLDVEVESLEARFIRDSVRGLIRERPDELRRRAA